MTPEVASQEAERLFKLAPVVPVLVVDEVANAAPLAKALIDGGLPVLEVMLRTPVALDVIFEMSQIEGSYVGAGTLLSQKDVIAARKAGAIFGVSPGATENLLVACEDFPRRNKWRCSCAQSHWRTDTTGGLLRDRWRISI